MRLYRQGKIKPGWCSDGLWHINTVAPCIVTLTTVVCPAAWACVVGPLGLTYNGQLITVRSITAVHKLGVKFLYEPGNDRIIAHIVLNTTYWPSWDVQRYGFNAEDGAWCNRKRPCQGRLDGIWGAYTQKPPWGASTIYACRNNETKIGRSCGIRRACN